MTGQEIITFFGKWLNEQGLHLSLGRWAKVVNLIAEDPEYWGSQSCWKMYERSQQFEDDREGVDECN